MKTYSYQNPATIAKILIALLAIGTALDLAAVISDYLEVDLLISYRDGAELSDETANANDARQAAIAGMQVLVYLVTVVVFCMWTYRISSNAHSFNSSLKTSPGWAVGYYFIPILTLWKPYQALKEAYDSFSPKNSTLVFPLWWFSWIVTNIVGRILLRATLSAEGLDEIIQASLITLGSDTWNLFLDTMAILLVSIVTRECQNHKEHF